MDMDYVNEAFYNEKVADFDKIPFREHLLPLLERYLKNEGSSVLDVGSGPGALARWITDRGHHVVCVEPARQPAARARAKGLQVIEKRLQELEVDRVYDLVLAISSLIHIPRAELPQQMVKLSTFVCPAGIVIVTFIVGQGEGYEDPTNVGKDRYFAKYGREELEQMFASHFVLLESRTVTVRKMNQEFVIYVLKRSE